MAEWKCYTLCFDPVGGRFDTSLLDRELRGRQVRVVDVDVFKHDGLPQLNVLLRVCPAPDREDAAPVPATAAVGLQRAPSMKGAVFRQPPVMDDEAALGPPTKQPAPKSAVRPSRVKSAPLTTAQWRARLRPEEWALFDQLNLWRATTARSVGRPAYGVLTNRALAGLAATRPTSTEDLLAVPGIGKATADRHGASLCELIQESTH